jgi:hypothetical protein
MSKKLLGVAQVREREGMCATKTIDRRVQSGALPPPIYINGRRYWEEDALDAHRLLIATRERPHPELVERFGKPPAKSRPRGRPRKPAPVIATAASGVAPSEPPSAA